MCSEDHVYMGDHELCKQYVLSDFGNIFYGNEHQISAKPWNYGQVHLLRTPADIQGPKNQGPAKASRFDSNLPIRKFSNRIGRAFSFARRKLLLSPTTQTIANGA